MSLPIAIIGGGPASFYFSRLLKQLPNCYINLFEKQLCPFGLLRYGVAPDHMGIKKSQIALSEGIRQMNNWQYFGNTQITIERLKMLQQNHSIIIHGYGAQDDRRPQWFSKRDNTYNSRQVVYWYNSHPNYELKEMRLKGLRKLVIVGNGNVSIDISRILMKEERDRIQSELSQKILRQLKQNTISTIIVIGRRGICNSSFALKQIRELYKLEYKIIQQNQIQYESIKMKIQLHNYNEIRQNERKLQFMMNKFKIVKEKQIKQIQENFMDKKIIFRYQLNPYQLVNNTLKCRRIRLQGELLNAVIKQTEQIIDIDYDMLVNSTGFTIRGIKNQVIKHQNGRILNINDTGTKQYVIGWTMSNARGVIDSTLLLCQQTFNTIQSDLENQIIQNKPIKNRSEIIQLLNINDVVDFWMYEQLRKAELKAGNPEKFIKKKFKNHQIKEFYKSLIDS